MLFTVEKMCFCLKVSKSSYYRWLGQKDQLYPKTSTDHLRLRIKALFYENYEIYGSLKIKNLLAKEGLNYCRSYVARLMAEMELKSLVKRKHVITTDSKHSFPRAKNKLSREFETSKLGYRWVSDITYIRTGNYWSYLTTVIDLADRKVVGWALSRTMTAEDTTIKAYQNAKKNRTTIPGFIFHSDQGVQYAAKEFTKFFLFTSTSEQSMSRKGNCWDNAVAESFFKSIKCEWLYRYRFNTIEQVYFQVDKYIKWYNTKRIHASLGYLTPLEMEEKIRKQNDKLAA